MIKERKLRIKQEAIDNSKKGKIYNFVEKNIVLADKVHGGVYVR